ncbi:MULTISPECIES: NAD-dependent epimerase/dehydratase family protein [unclassified Streptomyces]|uniref:NAD-dependent epimerase/dehydratase family protein n=1 Tax=unclassified Streptomyces TaxID=2593676 RepID=UPI0016607882|nr:MULTISPECIES: NAD-dependent epimerase/dehydratase family protein [unclassified Streptomyces]MBD0708810.1 NAD-dependent epimerase [Streptomyces sp. CBMA291]MBD0714748.1 NAD-dependent epimerase [Streptomyces sp. CBMA370]
MNPNTLSRVVVTGATGNVGTSLVRALADEPRVGSVLGLARRRPDLDVPGVEWAEVDLSEEGHEPRLAGYVAEADAVVHLAWRFGPTHDPAETWRTNVLGAVRVFDAVAAARVPVLVHASSVGAYSPGPSGGAPVSEAWPTHGWPEAAYTREKAYLERVLDTFERDHPLVRVVRMRPAFLFKEEAASEQRRIFAGRFFPGQLIRPDLLPLLPEFEGLRFQVLHTEDAADAYLRALLRDVRGPFNLAAEPVLDAATLGGLLNAKPVRVPAGAVRGALSAAWHLRLVPASPGLFEALRQLPLLATERARRELEWEPKKSSLEAVEAFLRGVRSGKGESTGPLAGHRIG